MYANKLASHQLLIWQQNAHTKTLKKLAFSKHLSNMTDKTIFLKTFVALIIKFKMTHLQYLEFTSFHQCTISHAEQYSTKHRTRQANGIVMK